MAPSIPLLTTSLTLTLTLLLLQTQASSIPPPNTDQITALPGQPPVTFRQYSGYISVDDTHRRSLFYYFTESPLTPLSKPLLLWLNGGPGCSSVGAGAFSEHGPFRPTRNSLTLNPYSWNKEANVLYLESPAGVGFSFSSNRSFYSYVNDAITAADNLKFLQRWLAKFPEYRRRDLFIAGESYGGHYVPQLANLVLKSDLKSSLKGIAIGNPLLEFNTDFNARGEYFWSHGLISDATFEMYGKLCNFSQIRRQATAGDLSPACSQVNSRTQEEIGKFIDSYDVIQDVCLSGISSQAKVLDPLKKLGGVDVCVMDETTTYLNRRDVQRALHVKQLTGVPEWSMCSEVVRYDMQDLEVPTLPLLGVLAKSGVRVMVYSGDQDSVLPFTGTRILVDRLAKELKLKTTQPYRSWLHARQVGGWTQVYGDVLTFATIRGAAHEAPLSQPERSLALFAMFVQGKPLPPAN